VVSAKAPKGRIAQCLLLLLLDTIAYLMFCLFSKQVREREVVFIAYHSVGTNPAFYTVTPETFRMQIDYLRKNYEIVPLGRIVDFVEGRGHLPRKSVAITFDDGYHDNFSNAYPYLRRYGMPATIFVCTGVVGQSMCLDNIPLKMLGWEEIVEMSRNNVEIGAHTVAHQNLSKCSAKEAGDEIAGSKRQIESRVGKSVRYFAYPSSGFKREVAGLVRSLGFRAAFLCSLDGAAQRGEDTFALHRMQIDSSVRFYSFKAGMTKGARWYYTLRQRASDLLDAWFADSDEADNSIADYSSSFRELIRVAVPKTAAVCGHK
jgi:peptidoglycan/xylan/chitin deacetylase (PgdA/CDA1 family)